MRISLIALLAGGLVCADLLLAAPREEAGGRESKAVAPLLAPPLDGAALYDRARAASVEILVAGRQDGSGWFASDDGLVVTAAHVVWGHFGLDGDAHRIEVTSPSLG